LFDFICDFFSFIQILFYFLMAYLQVREGFVFIFNNMNLLQIFISKFFKFWNIVPLMIANTNFQFFGYAFQLFFFIFDVMDIRNWIFYHKKGLIFNIFVNIETTFFLLYVSLSHCPNQFNTLIIILNIVL